MHRDLIAAGPECVGPDADNRFRVGRDHGCKHGGLAGFRGIEHARLIERLISFLDALAALSLNCELSGGPKLSSHSLPSVCVLTIGKPNIGYRLAET
ncbi:hypothetical protein Salmuc_01764 [Salipiger mucosus DSM 16094]|uniref:Uncharacterized protein n=1 Tax=Salipiger mucosus DSM 16094 TaxID=1123237 RepID=S9SCM7_9RHOB|nr:hypothetical protein Salmuc_01764 [Salipiger mucosus DSM 16094]